jgi:hypothetical protein
MNKRCFLTGLLVSVVLLTLLLIPSSNQQDNTYDHWKDLNDDGVIDASDLFELSKAYGISGEPINKTALLLELQDKVDSLNATCLELLDRVEMLESTQPIFITVYDPSMRVIPEGDWFDIVTVSNVTVCEGANVLAIATVDFYQLGWIYIRHRANDTYGENHNYESTTNHFVELHYVWTNMPAGTYTFAIQGGGSSITVRKTRLTLLIT